MAEFDKETEKEKKFTDSEFLRRGDLRGLSKAINISESMVYRVYQGVVENGFVETAIKDLIQIRKKQISNQVASYANDN